MFKCPPRVIEYFWAFVICGVMSMIITYLSCSVCIERPELFVRYSAFSWIMSLFIWIGNAELNTLLSWKISWVKHPVKRLIVGIIATVIFTVSIVLMVIKLWESYWNFRFNDYTDIIVSSLIITALFSMFFHGRGFLLEWKQSAVNAERYQKESMAATYENLKSQVNPHFLFNSLNALTNLVYEDQDKAAKFIKQLSEVYRYVLDTRGKEVVFIEEELKFLESYTFLQKIRFGEKLCITVDCKNSKTMVAPLAVQMLIENAIKHNEVSEANPLHISLTTKDGWIIVENNIKKKQQLGEKTSGMGLENIVKRYQFLSDKPVEIIEEPARFIVKLPTIPIQ